MERGRAPPGDAHEGLARPVSEPLERAPSESSRDHGASQSSRDGPGRPVPAAYSRLAQRHAAPDAAIAMPPANRPKAPLSEAVLAARPIATPAPVIHVTIDRLEVRAPAAARPAVSEPTPRRRPQPRVSLSDFLRGGGEGGQS